METIMYLVRHGETQWNQIRRIQGHSDIALNELGMRQAELVAGRFRREKIHAVYSSDLSRARETAAKIAENFSISVGTHPTLRERCYGQWEGLTYEEIRARFENQDEASCGIETFEDMQRRAVAALTELAAKHQNEAIVVVSHGGLINSFLHYVTAGEQGTGITRIDNTGISVFRYADRRWEVLQVNDTDHLEA
ncbi:histidine phosphatase family protein [Brevibacillus agri]|uniref:histidine phosphatase family protein n=1 Tax=Brevibacillus TaxID=55080 RepID=UPI000271C435|nr:MULTISPECIES: histidine phosphatase family protein [Brevibacillus]ELK43246.1 phosphoglycerate mutase [Brevibacillus agri BAB-2500]EJL43254.1 fructose-2,6-bisphosphatase [Brevibacillus sp. CF112]MBG9565960.1 phosphoglycerate mutase [Brevibacillus agri]MBY0054463.1 histidine phosphatase family protein [Brevibacillus agri]MCG5250917.1 histidine phosphatase family protein [Brevibacillus agri]